MQIPRSVRDLQVGRESSFTPSEITAKKGETVRVSGLTPKPHLKSCSGAASSHETHSSDESAREKESPEGFNRGANPEGHYRRILEPSNPRPFQREDELERFGKGKASSKWWWTAFEKASVASSYCLNRRPFSSQLNRDHINSHPSSSNRALPGVPAVHRNMASNDPCIVPSATDCDSFTRQRYALGLTSSCLPVPTRWALKTAEIIYYAFATGDAGKQAIKQNRTG